MIESLNSINQTKKNIMRDEFGSVIETAAKAYPAFPVHRSLSYHTDTILLVNELNQRGLAQHGLSPLQQYEFLLGVIPKGKRFAKWAKPQKEADIELVIEYTGLTYDKVCDIIDLIAPEELEKIRNAKGGQKK